MPTNLSDYLQQFRDTDEITILGPMDCDPGRITEPLILVDGGSRHASPGSGIRVGDGDSSDLPMDHALNPDKDMSDLAFVLDNLPAELGHVRLWGFLGGRKDHELFNLGEVHHYLSSRKNPARVTFEDFALGYSAGAWSFEHHGLFSLAAIEPCRISLTGDCRYPIEGFREIRPLSSLGLSNVGHGTIYLQCEGPAFILLQEDEPNE